MTKPETPSSLDEAKKLIEDQFAEALAGMPTDVADAQVNQIIAVQYPDLAAE